MMRRYRVPLLLGAVAITIVFCTSMFAGEERVKQGGWTRERDAQADIYVQTMEMTLHPRGEPRPALRYRLVPDDFDMLEGNAAIYYLKAMGFLEQTAAHARLQEYFAAAGERAQREKKEFGEVPPYGWLNMTPQELPLQEVKEFLRLTSFQPQFLKEAAQRRSFDLDRNLRDVDDPIGYLLPEVQSMRELARMQKLRCKVAIAEGRVNDAIEILGQQYAMARHLGQDEFFVSALVGIACGEIAWDEALHLAQHPESPNLYWAYASLPHPLVDVRHAMALERQFLYLQLKVLREVNETPRPVGYWQDFIHRLASQLGSFDFGTPWFFQPHTEALDAASHAEADIRLIAFVVAAYPGARRYLIEECGLPREQVDAYATAQVVFLAMVRYYDEMRDDSFKWGQLPYWQTQTSTKLYWHTMTRLLQAKNDRDAARAKAARIGWAALPAESLSPAIEAVRAAVTRTEQQLALIQTVEAIRMYGAAHDRKLPATLDDLPVPTPLEPVTGKPLDYQCHGEYAVLNGHKLTGSQYRLVLRFAEQ